MGVGSYICGYKEDDIPTGPPAVLTEEQKERNNFILKSVGKTIGQYYDNMIIDTLAKAENA